MLNSLCNWLDHRTGYRDLMKEALDEPIPGGARWRYVWGSTLVFTFFVQVVTGFVLWACYAPSTRTAWESVYFIQHEMTLGWFIRGVHHFCAQAMIVLLVFHLVQVVIDGAYKAPREVNFWLGLVLMQIVMGLGLTGYLLPWDQKGYYATAVATEIAGSVPVIGPQLQQVAQGGSEYGHHTLTRFFALHAGVLPTLLVAFLGLHIYVFRRHAIHVKDTKGKPDASFWPDQILKDGVACLAVLAAVMGLAIWKGAELTAPANPAEAYSAARPEWYYLFLFRFLKFEWVSQAGEATGLGEAFGAVVIPGLLMGVLVMMPLIARIKGGHTFNVIYMWVMILGAGALTGVALYEDWYQDDVDSREFRAAVEKAHVDGERTVELAQSPTGIPPEGAITLLRNDPLTQGPALFNTYCIECHQPAAREGEWTRKVGPEGSEETIIIPATAPELADPHDRKNVRFGSRDWIRSVLTDFSGHFQSLANMTVENGASEERAEAAAAIINDGSMADWSTTDGPKLSDPAHKEAFDALVEFLYAQSERDDALPQDDTQVLRGREIFESGELSADVSFEYGACVDCHTMHIRGEEEPLSDSGYPMLSGYGGEEWLRAFISDPDAHYAGNGEGNNAMPGFADQLSPQQLDLLVQWLTGDYYHSD
ncbi:MAG: cytochrome b N-terminal domain-containing protein [Planctomycetaceae bacterium]|nr:cytochrome b N-terminal domain-containing protein [Planctomycetaceae bacterium]